MTFLRSVRCLASTATNFHAESVSVHLLREMQNNTANLSSVSAISALKGKINFIVMCEQNDDYYECENWTLDLKHKKLTQNRVNDVIPASAILTATDEQFEQIINQRINLGAAITIGDVMFQGDAAIGKLLPEVFESLTKANH